MSKLIVANWKMNGSLDKITGDLSFYSNNSSTNNSSVILAIPSIYLGQAQQLLEKYKANFSLASQNISQFASPGAYTGEISGAMLKEFDVKYTLIGHSERRMYFNESGSILQNKIENALSNQIMPIFCIGEDRNIRNKGSYKDFIVQQLELLLQVKADIIELVIAYEPIWSIGTGMVPTSNEISEIINLIHAFVQSYLPHAKITALYGGSVSGNNARDILNLERIGGVLVGGASLKTEEFVNICAY